MKAIGIIGDLSSKTCVKSGETIIIGVYLKEAPSSTVTVSNSSTDGKFTVTASLSFTTGNYNAPQAITITAVEDSTVAGIAEDILTLSAANGGYDGVTKQLTVRISDAGFNQFFTRGYNWNKGIHQNLNLASARAAVESFVYNGGSKPSNATPTSTTTSYTGAMHNLDGGSISYSDLSDVDSITRLKFTVTDRQSSTWTFNEYHIFNSNKTKDELMIVCAGHGSEGYATTLTALQHFIDNGYDVLFTGMPDDGNDANGQNSTDNANATDNHKDILNDGIATNEIPQYFLFHSDKVQVINYMEANFSYDGYYWDGLSGGGHTGITLASYETRINRTADIRGIKHIAFKRSEDTGHWNGEQDYEAGGSATTYANCGLTLFEFFRNYSYVDLAAMCADNGRKVLVYNHANDATVNLGGYWLSLCGPIIESMATRLGGSATVVMDTDAGRTAHIYDSNSLNAIDSLFGD